MNAKFDLDYINNFPDKNWELELLMRNKSLKWDEIKKTKDLYWSNKIYTNIHLYIRNNNNFNWSILEYGYDQKLLNNEKRLDICPISFEKERIEYFIYRENQRIFMNKIKEELDAVLWHPNNIEYILSMGLMPDFNYEVWGIEKR
jgi:hypothetical protein